MPSQTTKFSVSLGTKEQKTARKSKVPPVASVPKVDDYKPATDSAESCAVRLRGGRSQWHDEYDDDVK